MSIERYDILCHHSSMENNAVGTRIRMARQRIGMTQAQLGSMLKVSTRTIVRIENGETIIDVARLEQIASLLKTSTNYLLGKTDNPSFEENEQEHHKSQAALDLEVMIRDLSSKNPDLGVLFRDTRENWDDFSEKELQAIADGLAFVFGKTTAEQEKRLKKEGRFGRL